MKNTLDFKILIKIIVLSLLVFFSISANLWKFHTVLPQVPLIAFPFNKLAHYIVLLALISSLIILFFKNSKTIFYCALVAYLLLVFQDINRLQIYYYICFALLFILIQLKTKQELMKICIVIVLAGLYFYSGFYKLNSNFVNYTFPFFVGKFHNLSIENWQHLPFKNIAYLVAVFELLIGVFILFAKTRKYGVYMAIAMHVLILLLLGPFGLNWNKIIWAWNILMILIVLVINNQAKIEQVISLNNLKKPVFLALFMLFLILPFFNNFKLWNNNLSFKLYSGTSKNAQIYVEQAPKNIPLLYTHKKDTFIDLNIWMLNVNNTTIYAEDWVIDEMAQKICEDLACKEVVIFQNYKESVFYVP